MTRYDEQTLVDAGHARLAYRRTGQGPDVVFVHGWPLDGRTWTPLVKRLADDYTCHVFDLPGAGATEYDDPRDVNLSRHADALLAAFDALGLDDYALVGQDSGGLVSRLVAARRPEQVRAMVFGNTEIPGHVPWMLAVYFSLAFVPGGRRLMGTLVKSKAFRRSVLGFGGCFTDPAYVDGEFFARVVEPLMDPERNRGAFELIQHFDKNDMKSLRRTHRQLKAPVRLVWGADDPWFPLAGARGMLDQLPEGSDLEVIDGGKLYVHEEHAATFARHTKAFLARHLGARAAA
ncbi:MAG: alpha/beta hydrolase [Deltaproteobacteria bacterium]